MKAMLYDVTRCEGCMLCVEACAVQNGDHDADLEGVLRRGELSATRRSTVIRGPEGRFVRRHCQHCLEPSCASACLVGALRKTKDGPVAYDPDLCIGCRYCMLACPFGFPRYEWETATPLMRKCEMCRDRAGGPACVAACPRGAARFGERDELLALAKKRIADHPGKYVPKVYGENDLGGTCVLYLSDVPLEELFPGGLEGHSIPELTRPFVSATPLLAGVVAGGLSLLSFIIHRRDRLARERREEAARTAEADAEEVKV
jgi:formate dehydrogenase iron-sulfur subunit